MDSPPSPPARRLRSPSWRDLRLIVGVLLIVLSMGAGTRVVASADRSVRVWALTRDVAVNTVLAADDLRSARVRLFDSAPRYMGTGRSPVGQAVSRGLSAGELLPVGALHVAAAGVAVNLPVRPGDAPPVERGQTVDVWAGTAGCGPRRVLASAVVQEVRSVEGGAAAGPRQVVVRVARADADRLLAVLWAGSTIRLVVVAGAPGGAPAGGPAGQAPCGPDGAGR